MTVAELFEEVRWNTRTDADTFKDEDILTGLNIAYGQVISKILQTTGQWEVNGKESYTNLISVTGLLDGQVGYNGEYKFPSYLIRPIRMEISYDGKEYYPANLYDLELNSSSEISELNKFSPTSPYCRFYNNKFVIRPLPTETVVSGLHIWYEKRQEPLSLGTDSPNFEANYHQILALMVAMRYARKFPTRMANHISEIQRDKYGVEQDMLRDYSNRFQMRRKINPIVDDYS